MSPSSLWGLCEIESNEELRREGEKNKICNQMSNVPLKSQCVTWPVCVTPYGLVTLLSKTSSLPSLPLIAVCNTHAALQIHKIESRGGGTREEDSGSRKTSSEREGERKSEDHSILKPRQWFTAERSTHWCKRTAGTETRL